MNEYNLVWSAISLMREQMRDAVSGVSQGQEIEISICDKTDGLLNELLSSHCDQFDATLNWLKSINDNGARFWEADCPTEIRYTPSQKNYVKNQFVENAGKPYEQVIEEFAVMAWTLSQLPRPAPTVVGIPGFGTSREVFVYKYCGVDFTPIMHGTLRFLMGLIQDLRTIYDEETDLNLKKTTFSDFFIDWLEVHFRFHVREYRKRNPPPPPPPPPHRGNNDDEGPGGFGPMPN